MLEIHFTARGTSLCRLTVNTSKTTVENDLQSSRRLLTRFLFSAFRHGNRCAGWWYIVFDDLISSLQLLKFNQLSKRGLFVLIVQCQMYGLMAAAPGHQAYRSAIYSEVRGFVSNMHSVFPVSVKKSFCQYPYLYLYLNSNLYLANSNFIYIK